MLNGLPLKKFQLGAGSQENAVPRPPRNAKALANGVKNPMSSTPPLQNANRHMTHDPNLKSLSASK